MPHKHTRRKDGDGSQFDLPPSRVARPLPSFNQTLQGKKRKQPHHQQAKHKDVSTKNYREDDTPRAFAHMMRRQQSGRKRRSGLDDGQLDRPLKKPKHGKTSHEKAPLPAKEADIEPVEIPKIMPGERMSDFAIRVNQALPVGGLARKGTAKIDGMKERQTKTEKRLHKMYASWRVEDARYKEQLEEFQEQEEEAEEEREASFGAQYARLPEGRRAKRKRMVGEQNDGDNDPWAQLRYKREAPKGLHDVVQAPPTLRPVKDKFKTSMGAKVDVANVPVTAGSLKRREELSSARKEVIERYRAMMKRNDQ